MPLQIEELKGKAPQAGLYCIGWWSEHENDDRTSVVKVGMSTNLRARLSGYHICAPFGFSIFSMIIFDPQRLPENKKERYSWIFQREKELLALLHPFKSERAKRLTGRRETLEDLEIVQIVRSAMAVLATKWSHYVEVHFEDSIKTVRPSSYTIDGLSAGAIKKIRGEYEKDLSFTEEEVSTREIDEVYRQQEQKVQKQKQPIKRKRGVSPEPVRRSTRKRKAKTSTLLHQLEEHALQELDDEEI